MKISQAVAVVLRISCLVSLLMFATLAVARPTPPSPDPETFNTVDLIKWSFQGIGDSSCGGYCITGICAHFNIDISVSITGGVTIHYYTIISPKIKHPTPEFLVQAYNFIGKEPYQEWRSTMGHAMDLANASIFGLIIPPYNGDGLVGGRPDPEKRDKEQSNAFKEVDIIGHPMAILPSLLQTSGGPPPNVPFKPPQALIKPHVPNGPPVVVGQTPSTSNAPNNSPFRNVNVSSMLSAMSFLLPKSDNVQRAINLALTALAAIDTLNEIRRYAAYFRQVRTFFNNAMTIVEATARSSFWANFINPQFRAPRLMCPNKIKPLQPYYLSFADFFYWRAGYPITDGPLTRDDHSLEILNPFTHDLLPSSSSPTNPADPDWGTLYPREGYVNNNNDAKVASVDAWRAMDVLLHAVPKRARVGLKVPTPLGSTRKWQLIFPEQLSCRDEPYYPSSPTDDFIRAHDYGSYAWNVYGQYECCSNDKGTKIGEITFPTPICLTLPNITPSP